MIGERAIDTDVDEARVAIARYEVLLTLISDRQTRQALRQEIAFLRSVLPCLEEEIKQRLGASSTARSKAF